MDASRVWFCRLSALALACVMLPMESAFADVASEINALTGSVHSRVVWLDGGDRLSPGGALWGYDSRDNRARLIRAGVHGKPNVCQGGHAVATTQGGRVVVVGFDDGQVRDISSGIVVTDVWVNPRTGAEYAIVRRNDGLYRVCLDNPSDQFLLWNQTANEYVYQTSGDGMLAVDYTPWPDGPWVFDNAMFQTNASRTKMGTGGCWGSVAPDSSHVWFHLNWPHTSLTMYRDKQQTGTVSPRFSHPPGDGKEIYHPRFASRGARYMVLTAGYPGNTGSANAEVFVGKFNSSYNGYDGWVRITYDNSASYFPDAWVGVVSRAPSIALSDTGFVRVAHTGGPAPDPFTVSVTSPSGALENVSASSDQPWLGVSVTATTGGHTVRNAISLAGLTAQVYRAIVTVRATNANPGTRSYSVTLTVRAPSVVSRVTVSPRDAYCLVNQSIQISAQVHDQYGAQMPGITASWRVEGVGATVSSTGLFSAGGAPGACRAIASNGGLSDTASICVVTRQPFALRVNCGGPATDGWVAGSQYVTGGEDFSFGLAPDLSAAVKPAPAPIYLTVRHQNHVYSFPSTVVPNGTYSVRLHFVDHFDADRQMNYSIEGVGVIAGFDVVAAAGGIGKVVVREFDVRVTDGNGLQISADQGQGNDVFEAGIEILEQPSCETATAGGLPTFRAGGSPVLLGLYHGRSIAVQVRQEGRWRLTIMDAAGRTAWRTDGVNAQTVFLSGIAPSGLFVAELRAGSTIQRMVLAPRP